MRMRNKHDNEVHTDDAPVGGDALLMLMIFHLAKGLFAKCFDRSRQTSTPSVKATFLKRELLDAAFVRGYQLQLQITTKTNPV